MFETLATPPFVCSTKASFARDHQFHRRANEQGDHLVIWAEEDFLFDVFDCLLRGPPDESGPLELQQSLLVVTL